MKILAIDTAAGDCSIALWEDGRERAFLHKKAERDQAAILPQLVADVMGQTRVDALVVNVGPGSFTGIRIGLAFAKGLSLGWGLPLKGIDSFTATYLSLASDPPPEDVLVSIDARRVDVFCKRFQGRAPFSAPPQNLTREDVEKILTSPHPPLVAGNGVHPFLEGIPYTEVPSLWQGAGRLAHAFFKGPAHLIAPLPFYVRDADAKRLVQ